MSAVGAPLMAFFGYLCSQKSPMIALPDEKMSDAGQGCYMTAALYAITLVIAYMQMKAAQKSASAREVEVRSNGKPFMPVAGEQGPYIRLSHNDGL
eukprot:CAMPEP_0171210206 /NCGR_PEP_ID=MMETSP0790-20130122/28989_1 /TAXON_ID=2925 /ORGANISM="Alexandrium catenella, Strain OF101" /LENGTH=95 /DNA_ID=CAMNT_0011675835 /DNA_START=77 /DNA_END=364 /DNA_ORIENTATION=-